VIDATPMLRELLSGFRRLSGAEAASLFVPSSFAGLSTAILLHDGDSPPVAELAEEPEAAAYHSRFDEGDGSRPPAAGSAPSERCGRQPGTWLIALPGSAGGNGHPRAGSRKPADELPVAWVGLRLPADAAARAAARGPVGDDLLSEWLRALGAAIARHASEVDRALRDPVTGLPARTGLQAALAEGLERSRRSPGPLGLLFINPDDFALVNERFGREAGDRILLEISRRLREALLDGEPLARYGGAIFAAVLPETPLEKARALAHQVLPHLTGEPYQGGALRLGFSIGVAVAEAGESAEIDALALIRRADQALDSAKRLGGGCIADWHGGARPRGPGVDRLSGIFTGNVAKDYRNMILLSDTLDVIAEQPRFEGLAGEVVERLYSTFRPQRVALFDRDDSGDLRLVRGLTRSPRGAGAQRRLETIELEPALGERLRQATSEAEPHPPEDGGTFDGARAVVLPLWASRRCLGALYLDGGSTGVELDSSDLVFLRALAAQLAVALDRARLSEADSRRQQRERKRLRAELNELRHALQQAKLVYRSTEMERLLAAARRVAPTDATVLITGESGTGKELLASTLHKLSPRRDVPMVVVDCGAIAPSLLESEIFGHERDSRAGATRDGDAADRRDGRLAQASGGTILLDEVSELPLEIQGRLLRFVQEKQFVPVGGQQPLRVDVRILAATHRDLAREVAEGRFREDLFHRLNVVRLEIPPLRERAADIPHLARHFLEIYSTQYHKHIQRMTPEAERVLLGYGWPGNVRELQNRLLQAVILCEGKELGLAELQIPYQATYQATGAATAVSSRPPTPRRAAIAGRPWAVRPPSASRDTASSSPTALAGDPMERLRLALALQVEAALATTNHEAFPLGKWLGEDLVLEAQVAANGVSRRGALLAGIPETTFRRRLRRASDRARAGFSPRTGNWDQVRAALCDVVRALGDHGRNLLPLVQRTLLEEILDRVPDEPTTGAKLLGVTLPTFRTRLAQRPS
jgi:diguanylate cyclase (GGDEF)-like protein